MRRCGPCSACCHVLAIPETGSTGWSDCQHQRKHGGCGIYTDRPEPCSSARCQWLLGVGANRDRPDLCGLVVWLVDEAVERPFVVVHEVWPGAAKRGRGPGLIARLVGQIGPMPAFLRVPTGHLTLNAAARAWVDAGFEWPLIV